VFLMGVLAGGGAAALIGLGVFIGISLSASSDPGSVQLSRAQEVLLVDPMTRAPAKEALTRWGRIAPEGAAAGTAPPQSAQARQAGQEANTLAGSGDAAAAAALLEEARGEAQSESERVALGFQQMLMLNTAGRTDEAKQLAEDIGRTARDFGTQRAALGALEGLEAGQ